MEIYFVIRAHKSFHILPLCMYTCTVYLILALWATVSFITCVIALHLPVCVGG